MTTAHEVVVVGNVGVDTSVYGDLDPSHESSFTENLDCVGQAGGYASRGYARLGRSTAFVGHVGDDFAGRLVRAELTRDGIDLAGLALDPAGTSRSINLMRPDGGRRNLYDGKGHLELEPDLALCRRILAGARLAHFHLPHWARQLLPLARELGVTVACDLQDVRDPDDPYRRDFVAGAEILFFSAADQASPHELAARYLEAPRTRVVVAGLGAEGCLVGTPKAIEHHPAIALDHPVVDTNGAGDSLAVGFLDAYVLEGIPLRSAILHGLIAARWCCTLRADSSHLVTRPDLEAWARRLEAKRAPLP